jgi:hypothetical protein
MKSLLLCLAFFCVGANAQIVSIPIPGSPLSLSVLANPQPLQELKNNPSATAHYLGDDGWANVPLPFVFPFYGQSFTDSTMYSNGAVQFGANRSASNNSFCCAGLQLSSSMGPQYNYSIMPLWTDLIGAEGNNHYTLGTTNSMTYGWYGVQQYGRPDSRSSFELKVDSAGGIDMRWSGAMVTAHPVTIGTIGNSALGEFTQNYFGPSGINITNPTQLSTGGIDMCLLSPLSSPTCPGYQEAYRTQQCTINVLYDQSCPGYQMAYFNQQCSINPLYNIDCLGYAPAYLNAQCRSNPLYSTTCEGYEQAYLNAECIKDSLYSKLCSGYATAYAIKYLVPNIDSTAVNSSLSSTAATRASDPTSINTNGRVSTTMASTTINNDGSISTGVSPTGNSNVDSVIQNRATSATGTSPAAAVQLSPQPPQNTPTAQRQEQKPEGGQQNAQGGSQQDKKDQPKSARQELQERREAAAKKEAVEKSKDLANQMSQAESMQQQVAVQNIVIQAMGFTPGFDVYNRTIVPDGKMYRPFTVYNNQQNVDNRRANIGLFGTTNSKYEELLNSQYEVGK